MADRAQTITGDGIQIIIDEEDNSIRVDPVSGTIESDQPDGGVVVQLDAHRPKSNDDGEDRFYANLADEISPSDLSKIASELCEQIEADDQSRKNHIAIRARLIDLLGFEVKEPRANAGDSSSSIEGQATVTNPLMAEAVLKGWANAHAEFLPSNGPCKIEDDSDVEAPAEDSLADAFERDMNYWFTTVATEYYPDTSHMLLWGTYLGGSGFKKIYRCPMLRRPTSQSIPEEDLIVSDTTKDLRSCARITHQIKMRPSVMKRMQLLGAYRKVALTQPTPSPNAVDQQINQQQGTSGTPQRPEDQPYNLWESQCEVDLAQFAPGKFKGEGIPLPYLVTLDKDAKEILAIRRDWREEEGECERKRMYIKYPYVPGPGFYGTGLGNILANCTMAMTAAWRLSLDAAMFANFPSGLIAKIGSRQNSADLRQPPGTLTPIETNNMPIQNMVMHNPWSDVTPGMMAMIDKVTAQAQAVGGVADTPTAEGVQNVPVGTMLAQIEQATKVMAAAHKGMHQAQAEEIGMIVDLFRETPEDFWKSNKKCKDYWNEEKFLQAVNDCNLVPRSDPNTPSHIHRVAKAIAYTQLIAIPAFAPIMDARATLNRIITGALRDDPNGIVLPQAPPTAAPPDPQAIAAQAKLKQANTGEFKAQADAQNAAAALDIKKQQLAGEQNIATVDLAKEMVIHKDDSAVKSQQHGLAVAQHGLNVGNAVHDKSMDLAQHALDVHQALTPPEPSDSGAS